jgi:hypothetical protein
MGQKRRIGLSDLPILKLSIRRERNCKEVRELANETEKNQYDLSI